MASNVIDMSLMLPGGITTIIEVECESYSHALDWIEKNKHIDGVDKQTRRRNRYYAPFMIVGDMRPASEALVPVRVPSLIMPGPAGRQ